MATAMPQQNFVFPDRSGRGEYRLAGYAPLAIMLVCLTLLVLCSGAFWAGRMVEQRSQLGRLLESAPAVEAMQAATRSADSLGMRLLLRIEKCRLPVGP